MIVTYKWLNDFVDLKDYTPKQVAQTFTSIGYEVDEMRELYKGMERVVIGKITKITRHPNADKLQICQINIGQKKPVQKRQNSGTSGSLPLPSRTSSPGYRSCLRATSGATQIMSTSQPIIRSTGPGITISRTQEESFSPLTSRPTFFPKNIMSVISGSSTQEPRKT